MGNVSNAMSYAKREVFRKRLLNSIDRGEKYVKSVKNFLVEFHHDFNRFAASTAHALRNHMTYRSDGGRIARGLVRASGDLEKIHHFFLEQNTPDNMPVHLDVLFWRRKDSKAANRWVMNLRFAPAIVTETEGEVIELDENSQEKIRKHRIDEFIDRAIVLAEDLPGPQGKRIRALLEIADAMPARDVARMWYYAPNAVKHFVDFRTHDKTRLQMTKGTNHKMPFDGYAYPTGSWRNYPFSIVARHYSADWTDNRVVGKLVGIDKGIYESRNAIVREQAKSSLGGGTAYTQFVQEFVKHVAKLEVTRNHVYSSFQSEIMRFILKHCKNPNEMMTGGCTK